MGFIIPQSTSVVVVFKAFLASDHVSEATGKTIAITISKAGGAFGNPNAGATNATEISSGWYKVTLDTTDTNTLGHLAIRGAVATVDDVGLLYQVVKATNGGLTALPDTAVTTNASLITAGTGTSQLSVSSGQVILQTGTGTGQLDFTSGVVKANVTQFGGSNGTFSSGRPEVNTTHAAGTAWASGALTSGVFASGAITAAAIAADAIGASELAADAATEIGTAVWATAARTLTANTNLNDPTAATIADAVWDELTSGHTVSGSFGEQFYSIRSNTAQAGSGTTITLDASASGTNDFYNGTIIVLTGGTGAGQSRFITDYVGATKVATVATWATNPSSDSTFVILPFDTVSSGSGLDAAGVRSAIGLASANLDTQLSTIDTVVDAILVDTGTTLDTALATVDTVVDAIKLKTDNLPSDPADASVVAGLIAGVDSKVDTVDTVVDAIKAKTDSLTYTVANVLDANIQRVNDVAVTGTGGSGDEWGA